MTDGKPDELARLAQALGGTPLDHDTAAALAIRRRAALSTATQASAVPRGHWTMPAATFAATAAVALALSLRSPLAVPPDLSADPAAAPYVFAGDDAELIEDLDFVSWLDARGHAG